MAYADVPQFARRIGRLDGLDDDETLRAEELLDDASGVIDDEIEMGPAGLVERTDTVTLDGSGAEKLLLPRYPVSAVESVVEIDVETGDEVELVFGEEYTWSSAGILTRRGAGGVRNGRRAGCWPCEDRSVRAVVRAGYATISTDVRRICLRLAAAGWRNPAGADSEDLGDSRVRWHTPGMELTTAEKATLARYKARA